MGILKDLLFGSDKDRETRPEKTERVDIRGGDTRKDVYDSQGHWKEEHRWNPHTDRWDKLDIHGNVIGHIERDIRGNDVHKDQLDRVVQVDKREDSRTVSHYDSKGNKIGYTTKDMSNNLTKHTYLEEKKTKSSPGFFEAWAESTKEYNRKMEELRKKYEYEDDEEDEDEDDWEEDDLFDTGYDDDDDDDYDYYSYDDDDDEEEDY